MGIIRELDSNTVVKIAAGEVIERPASVVRELIDNSVDAGASFISVRIASGGKGYIEVADNGGGMDKSDLELCTKNHSTSKIAGFDDLSRLTTLGFRGEALASIAEVSDLTVRSRQPDSISGHVLGVGYGGKQTLTESGMNTGTTVIVKELFSNIPARRKFLSTDAVETRFVDREIQKKALAFHGIGFELVVDGVKKYTSPARGTVRERIADFYPDAAGELIAIETSKQNLSVGGFVTKPAFIRKNRLYQHFFVNRRYIEWKQFYFLLGRVYGNLLPEGFFPGAFVYLEIDPGSADFNVHPMKKEVRFEREQDVAKAVEEALSTALLNERAPEMREESGIAFSPYEQRIAKAISGFFDSRAGKLEPELDFGKSREATASTPQETSEPAPEVPAGQGGEIDGMRFVGAAFRTYLIFEAEERLLFIDQHAAHERINYERLRSNRESRIEPQEYLIPINVDVPLSVTDSLAAHLEDLKETGFEVEHFGGNTFVVRSGPVFIDYEAAADVVLGYAQALMENGPDKAGSGADFVDEALKQMACKASVRSGDNLSREEAYGLIRELFATQRPFSCPHGRPIIFAIDKKDVDKNFKRLGFG